MSKYMNVYVRREENLNRYHKTNFNKYLRNNAKSCKAAWNLIKE